MSHTVVRRILALAAGLTLVLAVAVAGPAQASTHWVTVGSDQARALDESQGLTVIVRPGGTEYRYTGTATIPVDVLVRGYDHIGDPDSVAGYYIEPYQRGDGGSKMFRVQAPDGSWSEYVHQLVPGRPTTTPLTRSARMARGCCPASTAPWTACWGSRPPV